MIAMRDKSSIGWSFVCKPHLTMNQSEEIVSTAESNEHPTDIKIVS